MHPRRWKARHHIAFWTIVVLAVFLVGLAAGWWASYHYPYRTTPRPPLPPGQTVPNCKDESPKQHTLGSCLPEPKGTRKAASISASTTGPDLSNNDPVYGDGAWGAIAARNSWAIFKVNEGTGFIDSTAAPMANYAKRHGLVVGGYDFAHVCGPDPVSEANVFVNHLQVDGLIGNNTFPGTLDAEYGGSGCNARAWIGAWIARVKALTGRDPMVYTGAWWWNPTVGSYWPGADNLAWISGYGVRYPYMPSGRSTLDIWQFADNGFNGYNSVDLSTWRDGAGAFRYWTGSAPAGPSRQQLGQWNKGKKAARDDWSRNRCGDHPTYGNCAHDRRLVTAYQGRFEREGGYGHPKCWGSSAKRGEAVCIVARPTYAAWLRAAASSHDAYWGNHCNKTPKRGDCVTFAQRTQYFNGHAARMWRLSQESKAWATI